MVEPAQKRMTIEEYIEWCELQEEPYELVDGVPVPLYPDEGNPEGVCATSSAAAASRVRCWAARSRLEALYADAPL